MSYLPIPTSYLKFLDSVPDETPLGRSPMALRIDRTWNHLAASRRTTNPYHMDAPHEDCLIIPNGDDYQKFGNTMWHGQVPLMVWMDQTTGDVEIPKTMGEYRKLYGYVSNGEKHNHPIWIK